MRARLAALCFALLTSSGLTVFAAANAGPPEVAFAGDHYHLNFRDEGTTPDGAPGDAIAEFTLSGETVDDWTRMFAYYLFPDSGDDPVLMTQEVARAVKETNPDASYVLTEDTAHDAAMIDFLTWEPGSDVGEFNVFKYAPAKSGPGLVAMQFVQRFNVADMDKEHFQDLRRRMVAEMSKADITPARRFFARQSTEKLGSARATAGTASEAGADR